MHENTLPYFRWWYRTSTVVFEHVLIHAEHPMNPHLHLLPIQTWIPFPQKETTCKHKKNTKRASNPIGSMGLVYLPTFGKNCMANVGNYILYIIIHTIPMDLFQNICISSDRNVRVGESVPGFLEGFVVKPRDSMQGVYVYIELNWPFFAGCWPSILWVKSSKHLGHLGSRYQTRIGSLGSLHAGKYIIHTLSVWETSTCRHFGWLPMRWSLNNKKPWTWSLVGIPIWYPILPVILFSALWGNAPATHFICTSQKTIPSRFQGFYFDGRNPKQPPNMYETL